MNYLGNFQSLFEVSIALNSAFIVLETISGKVKQLFNQYIKNMVQDTLGRIDSFKEKTTIQLKDMSHISVKQKKKLEEKIQTTEDQIESIQVLYNLEKDKLFEKTLNSLKKLYVISATYAIYVLFFSGHLANENACMHTSFISYSILTVGYIIYHMVYPENEIFSIPIVLSVAFLLVLFIPYIFNLFADMEPYCTELSIFAKSGYKVTTYIGVSILFFPTIYGFYKFIENKNILENKFKSSIESSTKEIDVLEKIFNDISSKNRMVKQAQEASKSLTETLNKRLES